MKKYFNFIAVLLLGSFLGGGGVWLSFHLTDPRSSSEAINFETLLSYSAVQIIADNFSCEGDTGKNVGAVIGSIFDTNDQNTINNVYLGCFETRCALSISSCKPWQSEECNSRFLRFDLNSENAIIPSTFACIDMP